MKISIFLIIASCIGLQGVAKPFQLKKSTANEGLSAPLSEYTSYTSYRSFEVLKYTLHFDWYDILKGNSLSFEAISDILFRPDSSPSLSSLTFDLDSIYLKIDSVVSNGKKLPFTLSRDSIRITLDRIYEKTDTGLIRLYYRVVNPGENSNIPQRGFYLYKQGNGIYQTVAYTMSEPTDAHRWMPCYDDPSDKALAEVYVRVPDGYVAASNGELVSDSLNNDGSRTFHWRENFPVATYLMSITASKFSIVQSHYIDNAGTNIPVQYYVYPPDSAAAASGGGVNIDTVVSMISFYASIFGDYPFEKYGMVGIEPFQYGGMEHQTISTLKRSYEFNRMVVAHELAHQWWGDLVTLGTWKDIWLNESFATFSELIQLQHLSKAEYESELRQYADSYFKEDSIARYAMYDPPSKYLFGIAEYYKGAWVLKMLKDILGDSTFFKVLHEYRKKFAYHNATTSDFEAVVNEVAQTNMAWFFDQWIFNPGYPIYSVYPLRVGDSIFLTVTQIQTSAPIFKMPVEIGIYSSGNLSILQFWDSLSVQIFKISPPGSVDSIVIDPHNKLLAKYYAQVTHSVSSSPPGKYFVLSNYPNPFNGKTNILYFLPRAANIGLDVYDVIGRRVESLESGYREAGLHIIQFDSEGLSSGVYFCKLITSFGNLTIKLVIEK